MHRTECLTHKYDCSKFKLKDFTYPLSTYNPAVHELHAEARAKAQDSKRMSKEPSFPGAIESLPIITSNFPTPPGIILGAARTAHNSKTPGSQQKRQLQQTPANTPRKGGGPSKQTPKNKRKLVLDPESPVSTSPSPLTEVTNSPLLDLYLGRSPSKRRAPKPIHPDFIT